MQIISTQAGFLRTIGLRNSTQRAGQKSVFYVLGTISRKFPAISTLLLTLLTVSLPALANKPGSSLQGLADVAHVVIRVTMTEVSAKPVMQANGVELRLGTALIDRCFKKLVGPLPQTGKTIRFLYLTGVPEEPELQAGRSYFLFLEESEGGAHPVGGINGVVPIEEERARTLLILGQPPSQSVANLELQLEKHTSFVGCDDGFGNY